MKKPMKPGDLFNQHKSMAMGKKMKRKYKESRAHESEETKKHESKESKAFEAKEKRIKRKYKESKTHEGKETKKHEAKESKSFEAKENKMKKGKKNWIAGAIKHPGALHRQLGVKQGKKIPSKKLAAAAKKGGTLGRRARLAQTLKGLHK